MASPEQNEFQTCVWLPKCPRRWASARPLDDIPDAEMDRLAALGFDWFLSVWQTGPAAQAASRSNAGSRKEFQETLPELHEEDIAGSGFAIQNYTVHRGLKLMLDFVPNPMAPHHPWVDEQPDYFVQGNESDLAHAPLPTSKRAS